MKAHSKILMSILLLMSFLTKVYDQQVEFTASKADFNLGTATTHKIMAHDLSNFYVIKYYGNQYHLEKLDEDLNFIKEEPVKLFEGLKTYDLETIIHFHNQLYIFISRTRFSDIILYYQKLDKETLLPSGELTEVTKIRFIKGNYADFHFALSREEKVLMVACRTKLVWSKVQFNEFYVFGENLDLLWKRKDSFEFEGQGPRDNKYLVDGYGNVSILSLKKRESILSLISDERNVYTIYRYTHNGEVFNTYPVTLGKRYIRGVRIIGGNHGELICAGLYSELFRTGMRGTFFFKIDQDEGRIYDNRLNELDSQLMDRLAVLKEPTLNNEEEVMKYQITDMVLRKNGRIMLIAEQFFSQRYDTYNNLIVSCLDSSGSVYWSRVVEKNQNFDLDTLSNRAVEPSEYRSYVMETGALDPTLENYCSYALMAPLEESGIVIFYNDDIRNINQPEVRKNFNRPKKSYLLAVMIDEYGNITKQPVVKREKRGLFPEPIRFYDTLHNTIVIPAFKSRKFMYYKITVGFPL